MRGDQDRRGGEGGMESEGRSGQKRGCGRDGE